MALLPIRQLTPSSTTVNLSISYQTYNTLLTRSIINANHGGGESTMYTVYYDKYLSSYDRYETAKEAIHIGKLLTSFNIRTYITRDSRTHPAGQTSQYCGITKLVRCHLNNGYPSNMNHVCESE